MTQYPTIHFTQKGEAQLIAASANKNPANATNSTINVAHSSDSMCETCNCTSLQPQNTVLQDNYTHLNISYIQLQGNYTQIQNNYTDLNTSYIQLQGNYTQIQNNYTDLNTSYIQLQGNYTQIQNNYTDLNTSYIDLNTNYTDLNTSYTQLQGKYETITYLQDTFLKFGVPVASNGTMLYGAEIQKIENFTLTHHLCFNNDSSNVTQATGAYALNCNGTTLYNISLSFSNTTNATDVYDILKYTDQHYDSI